MARIRAGSSLVNQYVPPFVVPETVDNNWHLRWNVNLKAFEAYNPAENENVDGGFDSIEVYGPIEGAVGGTSQFVLPWIVASKAALIITINGVKQQQAAYSINVVGETTIVTMAAPIFSPDEVEFLGLQASDPTDIKVFSAIGDNLRDTWVLPWSAPSLASLIVTLDGLKQSVNAYSITPTGLSTTLTFSTPPGLDSDIEVVGITDTGETPASPVEATNLSTAPGAAGVFSDKTTAGQKQILNFRSLIAGQGVWLDEQPTYVEISSNALQNIGSGVGLILNPNSDPIQFRVLSAGTNISLNVVGDEGVQINHVETFGYVNIVANHAAATSTKIIGVNTAAPRTITLPASVAAGYRISIKDETGLAATNPITINTPGVEVIDGQTQLIINTNRGHATLYSNGFNWFRIG